MTPYTPYIVGLVAVIIILVLIRATIIEIKRMFDDEDPHMFI